MISPIQCPTQKTRGTFINVAKMFGWKFWKFAYQMEGFSIQVKNQLAVSFVNQKCMLWCKKTKWKKEILCKWLVIFVHGKKVVASPFVLETCCLIHVFHFHFNQWKQKFWQNGRHSRHCPLLGILPSQHLEF